MDSYDILVIVLSTVLAICLVLGMIIMVYVLKIVKNIKRISDKATTLVENASNAAALARKIATPATIAKFVAEQISEAMKKRNKEE